MVKKMVITLALITACILFAGIQNATAEGIFVNVSIVKIGQLGGTSAGHFTDIQHEPAVFTSKYFKFDSSGANQMLATCLTALSMNKNVQIRIKDDGIGNTVDLVWLMKD